MNPKISELLKAASTDIDNASQDLAKLRRDYEKAAHQAQTRLTLATSKLAALVSMIEPAETPEPAGR